MKILTWNINGIRASKTSLKNLFESLDADIICLQETKVTRDMLDEPSAIVEGYNSYFSFSRKRSGYSGVATFCKEKFTPVKAEEGLSGCLTQQTDDNVGCYGYTEDFDEDSKELENLDAEGRAVITQHEFKNKDGESEFVSIINVYVPRAADREDRKQYKLRFLSLLQNRAETIINNPKHHVIVLGDINTTHRALDNCDTESEEFTIRPSRLWMNQFLIEKDKDPNLKCDDEERHILGETMTPHLIGGKFVDSYRQLHPDVSDAFTNWCTTTNARENNYGRRLDYILTSEEFHSKYVQEAVVMQEIEGSDHCPVKVTFSCESVTPKKCPSLCTKYMPEFKGSQLKLSNFFIKKSNSVIIKDVSPENSSEISTTSVSVTNLKKRAPDNSGMNASKRVKVEIGKQTNLSNFFNKPKATTQKLETKQLTLQFTDTSPKKEKITLPTEKVSPFFKKESIPKIQSESHQNSASAWKNLLSGPGKAPLCKGHKEPCVLRTVKKDGPNKNKQFYVCARGEGHSSNPEARCDHFVWVTHKPK
ncbi:hypothetical protein LOTGIDRAFT_200437 [Lottia gigantea]|uniref:DNA-(apurinic or apyrimidinic site) endonuclease n=1 Tax=Lottia gigantea TaxID=225164 RepID=V4B1F0_LOTGI|nr:hypothetical protein LOTGIDRAFT_200437 [Lottia gigantea]ESP01136.1 hypothetical protein LOTGIDRAFT_200437 [Lottia gigantea]